MELITLCGLAIVVYGFWLEFKLAAKTVVKMIRSSKFMQDGFSNTAGQHPVCMSRIPICLANFSHYREGA